MPPIVHEVLSSPGRPLDASVRAFMESGFGHDFSRVRVHTDARAAESALAVDALAYAVGRDIVFGAGRYAPEKREGRRLLAHELTHVVQQDQVGRAGPIQIGPTGDPSEREATRVAQRIGDVGPTTGGPITTVISPQRGPAKLRRLIRTSLVTCPAAAAGVAHTNPFAADRRASSLLDNAIKLVQSALANRPVNPMHADVMATGNAMHHAFHMIPAHNANWTVGAPHHVHVPEILRRLQIAKGYIDSVVFTVNCPAAGGSHVIPPCAAGTCNPGTEAFSCHANRTGIDLCPLFWTRDARQQGRVWAHEVFHINFGFIDDWGQPDVHNAHCYAQFIALLNGFNSPAGFRCH